MLDFDTLINNKEVQTITAEISSHEFLFSRWKQFKTTKKERFPWGGVEISLEIDEANAIIKYVQIASDSLEPETITLAEKLLFGCNTKAMPEFNKNNTVLLDIMNLVFG